MPTYVDLHAHFLPGLDDGARSVEAGLRMVEALAAPERYLAVQTDPARAEALGRSAALLVDLGALDGAHGRAPMKAARRLLEERLAHAAASDVHTAEDQRTVAAGMAWIRKRLGP